ncbi:MAG: hypothetical protein CME70_20555 [Halobacteriovorax sp.]|nr:hypothetical protein [Halobacteriovorax sp.]|tara:strand:- start:18275 stop:19207 length:933 start_codon:yes stop_codon:yes gene_type:complete
MLSSIKERIVSKVDAATSNGKVYIFLTKSGAYFCILILILFIISLSYANSLAYLCSFLFFSVVFVSCHLTNFNLYGVEFYRLKLADYYFEDEEAKAFAGIKNTGEKTRFDIEAKIMDSPSSFASELRPGESYELSLSLPKRKMGLYKISRGNINTSFPFGIFKSWKPFKWAAEYLVIPRPIERPFPGTSTSSTEEGVVRNSLQKEEFLEHRKYSNESLQRIDWKLFAKRDELFLKEFDSSSGLCFNFNESMVNGSRSEVLATLTGWVLRAEEAGLRYSLKVNGVIIESSSGRVHLAKCLRAIVLKGGYVE